MPPNQSHRALVDLLLELTLAYLVSTVFSRRVTLLFNPTSSSWLSPIERLLRLLTQKQLKQGVFRSVKELKAAITESIDRNNESPKPFVWTKSAEEILEKVGCAKAALDNVEHV